MLHVPYAPVAPFALVLLLVALMPQVSHSLWEHPLKRLALLACAAAPAFFFEATWAHLGHTVSDYIAFLALIATLFIVAGGIVIEGFLGGTPLRNTLFLAAGSALASLIGTTGAAMLLVRPYLRANVHRERRAHQIIFFIVLVGNVGGLLLPMGDPPLFMGYLRGVPFFWTLRLYPMWLWTVGLLLALFFVVDSQLAKKEPLPPIAAQGIGLGGRGNVLLLFGVVAGLVFAGRLGVPPLAQAAGLIAVAVLSYVTTPESIHRVNQLSLAPIVEVASVFAAIFITLVPATASLATLLGHGGAPSSTALFWGTGLASSVLDNAPCYLAMASVAAASLGLPVDNLARLSADPSGQKLLVAISEGAVTMGALTYIGNGPNLLVRALAEQRGVKVPSFLGYAGGAALILLPVLTLSRWLTQ